MKKFFLLAVAALAGCVCANTEASTLMVKGTAGIDGVTVGSENVTPEYFTLQGVKVAAPEAGIYIVRCGSRVSKVYVK